MDVAVIVAAIAGGISILGWFISNIIEDRLDRRQARLSAQLEHVRTQLAELYGPLAFLVYEGRATWNDLLETLGRQPNQLVFSAIQPLPEEELQTWLFWIDHDFMPRNAAIQRILSCKTHLLVGNHLPQVYIQFLDHHNSWRVSHDRWKKEGVPYSWRSKEPWPDAFEGEVLSTFGALMNRHAELIGVVAST
jgi:hypothetical protein